MTSTILGFTIHELTYIHLGLHELLMKELNNTPDKEVTQRAKEISELKDSIYYELYSE